jgi:hypothetical protein
VSVVDHRSRRRHLHPPIPPPTKEQVCAAIIERAETIAAAVAARDPAVVRRIWDSFHTKYPELQALLLAIGMVADEEPELVSGFLARLGQFVDPGETHVWDLPHPAPRYAGWMWRHGRRRDKENG